MNAHSNKHTLPASPGKLISYFRLMRLNRPVGIYLVLWPTLWSLWLAAEGVPDLKMLSIFVAGVVLMRSAGCVINDFADRKVDGHVKRTAGRPIVVGHVSAFEAAALFVLLAFSAFVLVLFTNELTVYLSFGGVALAFIYPFMKRYTHLPQVVLGAAFAWAVPMAFAAQAGELSPDIWVLYTAVVLWTVAYDTFYAMVDRDDDIKIGVKSTAILFGEADRVMTGVLQFMTVMALGMVGQKFELGWIYSLSVLLAACLMVWQQFLIRNRERQACFKAFLNNNWVGMVLFVGLLLDYQLLHQ
ncbi:4-hydroxybenzoate octaprenyltransferase [Teredinibacter franksiae]|uniref:4-hydroxybenzoate octaprenyltransferase n=1 Tax=Teredinibacter franksiae TaxID=2761453 RepID=UPI001623EA69|nr:4-hydroxybenzoate octaprenyltransferase [Teredinibacter franksiae]